MKMIEKKRILQILEQHKEKLKDKYKVKELGIFGSYARGEQKITSDIDILVEFEEVPDLFTFLELEGYLEELLHTKVDLVRRKALRPELKDDILDEVTYL